jgi:branched-chain amino acid transport system substrate-binding protein
MSPASDYHLGIFEVIKILAGTSTSLKIALLYQDESFAKSVYESAKTYATANGHTIVFSELYPTGVDENSTELIDLIDQLIAANPDVILGGRGTKDGKAITKLLADKGFQPKLMSLLIAPAFPDFYTSVQACDNCEYDKHPAEGVCGPSQWEMGVKYSSSSAAADNIEWFGPSQEEFVTLFQSIAGADQLPSYQAAEAGQALLVLALAMEKAGSTKVNDVRSEMGKLKFRSFFGDFDIDDTGLQIGHKMVEVQWQQGQKVMIWPSAAKTGEGIYPMP